MEDLTFFERYYKVLHTIWAVFCALAFLVSFIGACITNSFGHAVLVFIVIPLVYFLGYVFIKFEQTIITRFIAATENIYQITVMIEEERNEKLELIKAKERKNNEIANTEKEITELEAKLAKAKEKFNTLKQ